MSELRWYGDKVAAAIESASEKAAKAGADHLLEKAKAIVPRDQGDLEESGKVESNGPVSTVSFGEGLSDPRIATIQHENLDFNHAPGRMAKYLERPMLSEAGAIFKKMSDILRNELQ